MDYLVANYELIIIRKSWGASKFTDCPEAVVEGEDIRVPFPELIGTEEVLSAVIAGEENSFELKGLTRNLADGSTLYLNIYFMGCPESVCDRDSLFLFFEDVTETLTIEQKLVQASNEKSLLVSALSASKNSLDRIIASIADALLVTTESGIIKTVNQAAIKLFGYTEEELVGHSISLILEDESFLIQFVQNNLLSSGEILSDLEVVCRHKNQEKVFVEFSCSAVETDVEGVQNSIYIGRNIGDRIRDGKRLAVQYAIGRVLSSSSTISEAIPKILLAICESLGWALGELWMPESLETLENFQLNYSSQIPKASSQLKCVEMWCRPSVVTPEFEEITNKITLTSSVGLPGSVWASGSPLWIADVAEDPNFWRQTEAAKSGLHAAFGFPIRDGSEVLGVMIFLSREVQPTDRELLHMMGAIGTQIGQFMKRLQAEAALHQQQEQTERLLLNILPAAIADRLKQDESTIAEYFNNVTVLFADIVGFTQLASHLSPIALVNLLNQIFSEFDRLTQKYGLEKIKTIGDAYMVVGGLPMPGEDHAEAIAHMALDMQAVLERFNEANHKTFSIRIGIHSGPVVAGVIGLKKFTYDLWGDTVNIASRMESHGVAGKIHVSDATYQLLQDRFVLEKRGNIPIKGKGEMTTYFLNDRLVEPSNPGNIQKNNFRQNMRLATQQMVELISHKLRED